MLGRIILYIVLAVLLLLAIALLIPIRARVSYDQGELTALLRFGPLKIPLYPAEKREKGKKEAPPSEDTERAAEKKKKPGLTLSREQIFYSLETLPPILGRALGRIGRRLRIAPLKVHVLLAGPDPADTALLYGRLEAALGALLPMLHRVAHIRDQDIRLFPDFQQECPACAADVGIAIRGWDLLVVALCAGGSLLGWYKNFRKLAADKAASDTDAGTSRQGAGAA